MSLPNDPDRSVGFLITDVSHLLRRNFDRRVQALGLTQAQWRAIAHIARNEGMRQAALADCLEVQPITLARLIDRMQAAGWVERRADPHDKRASKVYLTRKSLPLLAEMHERAQRMLDEALAGVSEPQRAALIDTLRRMKSNLSAAESAAAHEAETRTESD